MPDRVIDLNDFNRVIIITVVDSPTASNRQANFKVVRLAADRSEFGKEYPRWLVIAINPRDVVRKKIKLPLEEGRKRQGIS